MDTIFYEVSGHQVLRFLSFSFPPGWREPAGRPEAGRVPYCFKLLSRSRSRYDRPLMLKTWQ